MEGLRSRREIMEASPASNGWEPLVRRKAGGRFFLDEVSAPLIRHDSLPPSQHPFPPSSSSFCPHRLLAIHLCYFSLRLSVSLSDNNLYFPSCQQNPLKRPNPAARFQLPSLLSASSPVAPAEDTRRCLHQLRSFDTVC